MLSSNQILPLCLSNHLRCPKHPCQQLTRICLNTNCTDQSFICFVCYQKQHNGHTTLSLNQFLKQLDNRRYDQSSEQFIWSRIESLKKIRCSWREMIEKVKKEIGVVMDGLSQEVDAMLDIMERVFKKQRQTAVGAGDDMEVLTNSAESEKIVAVVKRQVGLYLDNQAKQPVIQDWIDKNTAWVSEFYAQQVNVLNGLGKSIIGEISDMTETVRSSSQSYQVWGQQQPQSPTVSSQQQLLWDPTLKHPQIKLTDNSISRPLQTQPRAVCILSIPHSSWRIRIIRQISVIALGICLESTAKQNKFVRGQWSSLGHGHYGVSSNGWTWSHSDANLNCQAKGLVFGAGDELRVCWGRGRLGIVKNERDRVEFCVQDTVGYRLFVYMWATGDQVQIEKCAKGKMGSQIM